MNLRPEHIVMTAFATAAILFAGGCASTSGPQQTVRGAESTAPADLQLTCASEAATRLGVDSTKVLPISSSTSEPGAYRVDLNVDGSQAVCMVNSEGSVLSVETVE
jgi:hypothetical protein